MTLFYCPLPGRALIAVQGEDARTFLQGLITNDIRRLSPSQPLYAALLSPQGKFLFDFFLVEAGEAVWLDCRADNAEALMQKLALYKLRAKVTLSRLEHPPIYALWGDNAAAHEPTGIALTDPRYAKMGVRFYGPAPFAPPAAATAATENDYTRHRLTLGVPEGGTDIVPEKSFVLESGLEELHGVDFAKGCYVGQEVTARNKYRGEVRKGFYRVTAPSALPPHGTVVTAGDSEIGQIRSSQHAIGLALLRHKEFADSRSAGHPLVAGGVEITATSPPWRKEEQ